MTAEMKFSTVVIFTLKMLSVTIENMCQIKLFLLLLLLLLQYETQSIIVIVLIND